MRGEPRAFSRARHRMPLVAYAAGVQTQRINRIRRAAQFGRLRRDETSVMIVGKKATACEETLFAAYLPKLYRPHHGIEVSIGSVRNGREAADVKVAQPAIFEGGERRMFTKDVGRAQVIEGSGETEAACHFTDNPPIGTRLARKWQECTLARDSALGIGHGSV